MAWMTRRRFLLGTIGVGAGLLGYTAFIEPHWVELVRRDLPIVGLPAALLHKKLVQVSDLHVGPTVDDDYLKETLQIARSEADILVITGDFMTCRARSQVDQVGEVLATITPAPLGTYAVLGNHDYGEDWTRIDLADGLSRRLGDLGVVMLRNQIRDLAGLQLVGFDDYWSPRFQESATLMAGVDPTQPTLVLCHNPDVADLDIWAGYRGWTLCGHTHGGQVSPPFMTPPKLPVKNKRYVMGEYDVTPDRRIYINRGLGYVAARLRFRARPEITIFRLTAG